MIFLSHSQPDKSEVSPIANKLAEVFGRENVFYDEWSIQPGDGIINKMNEGLSKCKYFFLFISKKSLEKDSKIFQLEWQAALYKATRSEIKVIPVKLDDCLMPDILLQTLYIDLYTTGFENGLRQIIDVASGNLSSQKSIKTFENIRGYIKRLPNEIIVEFRAETYTEPHSKYLILTTNSQSDLEFNAVDEAMFGSGFSENIKLNDGTIINGMMLDRDVATSPGFPFTIKISPKENKNINITGLMHATSKTEYKMIPMINE